jgi:hypothetical protein
MGAKRGRSRRRLKRAFLLALRVGRRHYLSVVSAAVLVVALGLALSNSALEVESRAPAPPSPRVFGIPAAGPIPVAAGPPAAAVRSDVSHEVFYYMFDSERARNDFETAILADLRDWMRRGEPVPGLGQRYFLVVTTPEEETAAFQYLNDLFQLSQTEGFGF